MTDNVTSLNGKTPEAPEAAKTLIQWVPAKHNTDRQFLPAYTSAHAAGMDMFNAAGDDIVIAPGESVLVPTGWCWDVDTEYFPKNDEIPMGAVSPKIYGRIAPRSGLDSKRNLTVGAGVVDIDYQGEIHVLLRNAGNEPQKVEAGERIAQLIITSSLSLPMQVVEGFRKETERGEGGFGHSGTH